MPASPSQGRIMASHVIKLSRVLRDLSWIKDAHKENVKDEYTRGLYNGLELAWALLTGKEPKLEHKEEASNALEG